MALRIGAIAYTHYESDPRVRREAEALAERGDDVTVWALRGEGSAASSEENGVRIERIRMPRYRGGRAISYVSSYGRFLTAVSARLAAAHGREKLDIVHVHTMPDFMVFAGLIPRLAGAKIVLDMHDLMPELYALKFGLRSDGWASKVLRLTQQAATSLADAVIAVHANQYDLLLRDGVPARKLAIVMNAADPKLFPPRAKEPPAEERIRIVYHGTVLHRYGVDVAVRAFAQARREEPRLFLSILGSGDFVDEVKALARELGLGPDALAMTGERRPLDEVAQAIRTSHLGVVPNRDNQEDSVLPTKLLEYIAVGIPAIATRTRCIDRFFEDGQVELVGVEDVAQMARAMVRLGRDPKRRRALVEAARGWEEEHGWTVNRRLLFRVMDALCFEKIAAERKAKQKAKEGVKTKAPSHGSAPQKGKGEAKGKAPAKEGKPRASAPGGT